MPTADTLEEGERESRTLRPAPATRSLPAPNPDVVSRRLGDEVVLVHLKTNRIFSLSPTGARFWELLSDGKSRTEIEAALLQEYEVTPKRYRPRSIRSYGRWKPSSSCKRADTLWSPTRSSRS